MPWTPSPGADPSPVDTDTNPMTEANLTPLPHLLAALMSNATAEVRATIHLLSFPPSSTGTANMGVVAPQTALSDDAARALIGAYIRTSPALVPGACIGDPLSVNRVYRCPPYNYPSGATRSHKNANSVSSKICFRKGIP